MTHPSPGTLKLKDYLLKQRPTTIDSANKLAREYGIEANSVIRILSASGYTKSNDSPVWTLQDTSTNTSDFTLTCNEEAVDYWSNAASELIKSQYTTDDGKLDAKAVQRGAAMLLATIFKINSSRLTITVERGVVRVS